MDLMTTVLLPWDSLLIMTAAMNQVRHIKELKKQFLFVFTQICSKSELVENCKSSPSKTVENRPKKPWMTVIYN